MIPETMEELSHYPNRKKDTKLCTKYLQSYNSHKSQKRKGWIFF